MEVTQEMLNAAMRAAVRVGMIPSHADEDTYLRNWDGMKAALVAALAAADGGGRMSERKPGWYWVHVYVPRRESV